MSKQRSVLRTMLVAAVALATLAASAVVATLPTAPADAANAANFNAGYIISDQNFYDSSSLSAASAQSFIASIGANCTNNGSLPCLKNLSVSSPAIAATAQCAAIPARSGINAGTVFTVVGAACGISPEVLITLVEKEQGLVSATKPSSWMYEEAAGFACPDTAPCSETYSGFFNQIYAAARQFQLYRQYPSSYNYQAGRTNNIQYSPTASCGTESVYIQNQATAGLYDYTPYVPNGAALANLYGTGNSCSAYGNRNFWRIYSDWFGSPTGPALQCASFEGCRTGWGINGSPSLALYNNGGESGSGYLALVPHNTSSGIEQTLTTPVTVGDTWTASLWIRTVNPSSTATGRLVIWGLGGSGNENAGASYSVGGTWTQVNVTFQAALKSHTQVRIQLYLGSPNVQVNVDNATLTQSATAQPSRASVPLVNPSFEDGRTGWAAGNGFINQVVYSGGAKQGGKYYATNTTVAGRSVQQTVSWPVSTASSYTGTIWVKAASASFSGTVALWGLGGSSSTNATTPFTVGTTWTPISVTMPVTATGQTSLRLEVYDSTLAPVTLDIDSASLHAQLLSDGSFEQAPTQWNITPAPPSSGAAPTNLSLLTKAQGAPQPVDGTHTAATNIAKAGGSLYLDTTRQLQVGETYTASIWIKAQNPGTTFAGSLALFEMGSTGTAGRSVSVTAGNTWKQYSVSYTVTKANSTVLRLQLYEGSVGVTAFLDGATLW